MRRAIWFSSIALALGLLFSGQAHADSVLYGVRDNASGDELVIINPTTGDVQSVGIIESVGNVYNPFYSVLSLAYDSNSDTLYAVDVLSNLLLTLDRETGQASGVGSAVGPFIGGLSFDDNGTLYGIDSTTSWLYTIDTNNGAATFVQAYDNTWTVGGIEFNSDTGELFGVEVNYDQLVTLDPAGGSSIVGSTGSGYPRLSSLTYDPLSQLFLATEAETHSLVSIDPGTGATTFLADLQGSEIHGLTFVPAPVPVPPAAGIGLLGLGLVGWMRRRNRQTT